MKTFDIFLILYIFLFISGYLPIWGDEKKNGTEDKENSSANSTAAQPAPNKAQQSPDGTEKDKESEKNSDKEPKKEGELEKSKEGETFGVPIPVFSTNPNEGTTMGVLLAVVSETEGRINSIFAPVATYNEVGGYSLDINYFSFPSKDLTYQLYMSHTTENFWSYSIEYRHKKLWHEDFRLEAKLEFFRGFSNRFFGLGPNSKEKDESCYTLREVNGRIGGTLEFLENVFCSLTIEGRREWVRAGILEDIYSLDDRFPNVEGVEGSYAVPLEIALTYDSRNDEISPTKGLYARIYGEFANKAAFSSFSFQRYGAEARAYIAIDEDERFVTVFRCLLDYMEGKNIPFYELNTLGGEFTLRGFGRGRFFDNHRILFNAEERVRVVRFLAGDIMLDIEGAVFLDVGQVFNSFHDMRLNDFQTVVGMGVRLVIRSQIVAKVDFGYGQEGTAIFAGLNYPF